MYLSGFTIMLPYLDLFLTVVVLLGTGTSGGEAADERRSVVGGIEVKMLGRGGREVKKPGREMA